MLLIFYELVYLFTGIVSSGQADQRKWPPKADDTCGYQHLSEHFIVFHPPSINQLVDVVFCDHLILKFMDGVRCLSRCALIALQIAANSNHLYISFYIKDSVHTCVGDEGAAGAEDGGCICGLEETGGRFGAGGLDGGSGRVDPFTPPSVLSGCSPPIARELAA